MAQNVLLKYGDTSVISGETIQQGKILIDTQNGEISIDKDGTTRLPLTPTVDTALSTTSTNPIANNAITNSIVNTTAEVSAITADNIPCGTKPVKELINSLTAPTIGQFIYDYQGGVAGYNTESDRGADTFHPFSRMYIKKFGCNSVLIASTPVSDLLLDCSKYSKLKIGYTSHSGSINAWAYTIVGYIGATPTTLYNSASELLNAEYNISTYDTLNLVIQSKGSNSSTYGGSYFNEIYLE